VTAFSRESSFAIIAKILKYDWFVFRSSEELRTRPIILKNFTTIAKLLSLLNAANAWGM